MNETFETLVVQLEQNMQEALTAAAQIQRETRTIIETAADLDSARQALLKHQEAEARNAAEAAFQVWLQNIKNIVNP